MTAIWWSERAKSRNCLRRKEKIKDGGSIFSPSFCAKGRFRRGTVQKGGKWLKKRILIVDDPDIGNMLAEVLAKAGYETVRAYSGTEALLVLEKSRPDLILLDLMLPGLSGEQVLPYLRDIPVIVLSAKAQAADKVELLMGGAVD